MPAIRSYPYPVLMNGEDIEGGFTFELNYLLEPREIRIECKFDLQHETLQQLIVDEKAVFVAELACPTTFLRKSITSKDDRLVRRLRADEFRGVAKVSAFVVSVSAFDDYYPTGVHEDLQGDPFRIESGDILALGGTASFIADKEFDPMRSPAASFIKVQRGARPNGPFTVDYRDRRIVIELSHEDHDFYTQVYSQAAPNLHASVVLPVLIDTLHMMSSNGDEYEGQEWLVKLQQICESRSLDPTDTLETAQAILRQPITRNFAQLQDLLENYA
jgi:hypothetical protein